MAPDFENPVHNFRAKQCMFSHKRKHSSKMRTPAFVRGGDTLLSGRNTGPEIPYPPKEHGTRDTLPPKEHGTRDTLLPRRNMRPEVPHPPRRNMGPKIPYPLPYPPPVDRMIYFCENITFPQLRLRAVIMVLIFVFFPKCSHFQS